MQDNGTEQPTGSPQQAGTLQEAIEQQWSGQPAGQKENTAETGGERYSSDDTVIDLSSDNAISE